MPLESDKGPWNENSLAFGDCRPRCFPHDTTDTRRFWTMTMTMDTTTSPDGPAWYFGYGANMAASVFIERRQIRPLRTEVAYIPSHALCFNVLGIPYVDPGNGGIRPLCPETTDPTACVHGVAYLLTPDDLKKVVLSEGCVPCPCRWLRLGPFHVQCDYIE